MKRAVATVAWVLLLWLTACATSQPLPPAARDGEAQAVAIAWRVYGRTDTPPRIRWLQGDQLTCTDPASGRPGFSTPVGCREGWTFSLVECVVAWHDGDAFSDTALAHELLHVAHTRAGIIDTGHDRPDWQPGGLLDRANEAMREAGR